MLGKVKNVTVSKSGNHWFVSIQTEQVISESIHPSTSIIGGDLGVKRLLTLSDNTYFKPIDTSAEAAKIKQLQRKLAKKVRFSNNWTKTKQKITKLNKKMANIRLDKLHKLSTNLSKSHAIIVLENLQIKNMMKSAKGDAEQHGKMVKQKSGLNRVILNQGW
jgi:putative transposase